MGSRTAVALAGLLGGLAWLAAAALDAFGAGGLVDALTWVGLVLLLTAALGAGAGMVSPSTPWLRVLVAICFVLLLGSVLQIARGWGEVQMVDAVFGVLAVVAGVAALARSRPAPQPVHGHRRAHGGSHGRAHGSHAR